MASSAQATALMAPGPVTVQSALPGAGPEVDAALSQARSLLAQANISPVYDTKHQHTVCPHCGETWLARRGGKVRRLMPGAACVCGAPLPDWLSRVASG